MQYRSIALRLTLGLAFLASAWSLAPRAAASDSVQPTEAAAAIDVRQEDGAKQDGKKKPRVKKAKKAKVKKAAGQAAGAAKAVDDGPWRGEPYTLETCAASGRPIDVKGTPQTKWMHGRELKFCCGGCAAAVEKDPAKWLEKVDKALIAQQSPIYPTDECLIAGTPLYNDEGKFTGKELMVGNRLFRVCCDKCAARVTKNPAKFAGKLDELVLAAANKDGGYPLEKCPVSDDAPLDETSQTTVVAGRAIKTCCKMCAKEVRKNPLKYIAIVDAAAAAKRAEGTKGKDGVDGAKGKNGTGAEGDSGGKGLAPTAGGAPAGNGR